MCHESPKWQNGQNGQKQEEVGNNRICRMIIAKKDCDCLSYSAQAGRICTGWMMIYQRVLKTGYNAKRSRHGWYFPDFPARVWTETHADWSVRYDQLPKNTILEKRGLQELVDGESVSLAAKQNRIEMFGAIRAAENCLQCHNGQRGKLLGAFTYKIFRDPPIKAKPQQPKSEKL